MPYGVLVGDKTMIEMITVIIATNGVIAVLACIWLHGYVTGKGEVIDSWCEWRDKYLK